MLDCSVDLPVWDIYPGRDSARQGPDKASGMVIMLAFCIYNKRMGQRTVEACFLLCRCCSSTGVRCIDCY